MKDIASGGSYVVVAHSSAVLGKFPRWRRSARVRPFAAVVWPVV